MKRHFTGDTDAYKRAKLEAYLERLRIAKLQMLFNQKQDVKCFDVTRTPLANLFSK